MPMLMSSILNLWANIPILRVYYSERISNAAPDHLNLTRLVPRTAQELSLQYKLT